MFVDEREVSEARKFSVRRACGQLGNRYAWIQRARCRPSALLCPAHIQRFQQARRFGDRGGNLCAIERPPSIELGPDANRQLRENGAGRACPVSGEARQNRKDGLGERCERLMLFQNHVTRFISAAPVAPRLDPFLPDKPAPLETIDYVSSTIGIREPYTCLVRGLGTSTMVPRGFSNDSRRSGIRNQLGGFLGVGHATGLCSDRLHRLRLWPTKCKTQALLFRSRSLISRSYVRRNKISTATENATQSRRKASWG